jgi:hypothetical protein
MRRVSCSQFSRTLFILATAGLTFLPIHRVPAQAPTPPAPPTLVPGQRPPPPTGTIAPPGFSIEIQPGRNPVPIDPATGAPLTPDVEPAGSATFDPPAGRVGRPVEYRVTITGGGRISELPALVPPEGLQFDQGPRGYSTTFLNGQPVLTSTLRFTAIATRAGEYVVPSFQVQVGRRQLQIPAARLVITEPQPGEAVYQPVKTAIDIPNRDYFIGETIEARLLFIDTPDEQPQYVQHVAKSSGGVLFKPSMRTRREQITWQGKPYNGLIMPVQITPLVAGETEVNCQVIVHVGKTDALGRRGILTQSTIDIPSARFRVLPLPQARPAGFTGAIGEFTVAQPKLSATELEIGEPLTLTVALSGQGNIDGVPAPELPADAQWTAYRPTAEVQREDDSLAGTKVFTYTLIPKRVGRHGTPSLPFAYFDPVKRTFVDITVPPVPVLVKASAAAPAGSIPAAAATENTAPSEPPREAEPTLTGLSEQPGRWHVAPGPGLKSFLWFQIIPPALLLALWSWRRRNEYLARHPDILRRRNARAAARRALAQARAAAQRGDHAAFVQASLGALREAAAPLDTAEASSLTRQEVLHQLRTDERAARTARTIFETAEASRYASRDAVPSPSAELLPEVEHAVARLTSRR